MDVKILNSLYVAYFWKYITSDMLEEILDYDIDTISVYILEMGQHFYETKELWKLQPKVEKKAVKVTI